VRVPGPFLALQTRERNKAKETIPAALHQHGIQGNTQEPGLCVKMHTACGAGGIDGLQSLLERILSQVLALLPIAGQTIDCMENQLAVFLNECFDRLRGRQCVHNVLFTSRASVNYDA
jgi:hypothetical protein